LRKREKYSKIEKESLEKSNILQLKGEGAARSEIVGKGPGHRWKCPGKKKRRVLYLFRKKKVLFTKGE